MKKLLMVFWAITAVFLDVVAQEQADMVVSGIVRDRANRRTLENVTVSLAGTSAGTVTNADGAFSFKIPAGLSERKLVFSHIGYDNAHFTATESTDVVVWMIPAARQLDEAIVYGNEAQRIVVEALKKIPENYSPSDNLLSTFYRETVRKNNRYIGISEAMMDVYKTDYSYRGVQHDKVQLSKARRLMSQRPTDTLAIKIVGGPNLSMLLDIVKNPDALFDSRTINYYDFEQEESVMVGDRLHYVISFTPRVMLEYALFEGKLFIDRERLSFTRAEFSLDLSDEGKAVASILYKKPTGLRFKPLEVNFLVSYRDHDGISYLNYICNEIRFKCDWRRRLFSSAYTTRSEMVVVENDENPDRVITNKDAFKSRQIFYDIVEEYWEEDFWKDYNIIEPTETLENAVRRLRR